MPYPFQPPADIYEQIAAEQSAEIDPRDAEIARLRTENAEMRRLLLLGGYAPAVLEARLAAAVANKG